MKAPFVKKIVPILFLLLGLSGSRPTAEGEKVSQGSLDGIVLPDNIHDRQPFSFAAPQVAEGDVVAVKSLDGVVVDKHQVDKRGRMFLPTGLSAGTYLISRLTRDGHSANDDVKIDVRPAPNDATQRPWEHPSQQVEIANPPRAIKVGDPLWLSGHGFSPNSSDMEANLFASGETHTVPVLAATEDQLKLAPITDIKPGPAEIKVTNSATHQSAPSQPLFFYDLQAHLEQSKLKRGQQTMMVLEALPANVKMKVHVTISGQATFAGGQAATDGIIDHGRLTVPVEADRGAGNFHIEYEGEPQDLPKSASCGCGCGGTAQPGCAHKGCSCANSTATSEYAGCSCGCGGTAQPACAHKGCACSKAIAAAQKARAGCSCGCGGATQPACAHKNCACANAASLADGVPVSLKPKLDNVSGPPSKPTGKAGCSCGCGGTAQPRCAHKACGCAG